MSSPPASRVARLAIERLGFLFAAENLRNTVREVAVLNDDMSGQSETLISVSRRWPTLRPFLLLTSKAHLWDAHQACLAALALVGGVDVDQFYGSLLIQSAVERQLEILGEALNRLGRTGSATADEVPDLDRVIGMGNIIAHEYGVVDQAIVWAVVDSRLVPLADRLAELLDCA